MTVIVAANDKKTVSNNALTHFRWPKIFLNIATNAWRRLDYSLGLVLIKTVIVFK